jgi:hypothetical protein
MKLLTIDNNPMTILGFNLKSSPAAAALLVALLVPAAQAATLTLTQDPNQVYYGINVGPYPISLSPTTATLSFCLDENLISYFGASYDGTLHTPSGQQEEESAFLASYALYENATNPANVSTVAGPISNAIWSIMGTLETDPLPPDQAAAAQYYIDLAQNAYATPGLISSAFLSHVYVFVPDTPGIQRFVTAYSDTSMNLTNSMPLSDAPEPGTLATIGTGALLVALGRRRKR